MRRLCPELTNAKSIALHRPGRCIWQWLPAGDPVYADQKEWYDKTAAFVKLLELMIYRDAETERRLRLRFRPIGNAATFEELRARGYPVMIGEFGCYNRISHATALAWMEDCLKLWRDRNLGWALWNLDGPFGILDSERKDVVYEDFEGHKLDRKMLDLLRKYAQ